MKDKVTETLDRLRGFDSRRLQCEMTDGLAEWQRRRAESARNRRQYLVTTCIMLLLISVSYRLAPTLNYRLADNKSYEEAASLTYYLLGQ
jgi:hypothetical protein